MAKKRTKKQKARATYHYAYPAGRSFVGLESQSTTPIKPVVAEKVSVVSLYQYDPKYVRADLRQTFLITLVMLAVEIGLYFWL